MAKKKRIGQFVIPEDPGTGSMWLIAGAVTLPSVIISIFCFYMFLRKFSKHLLFKRFKEACAVIGMRSRVPLSDFQKVGGRDIASIRKDMQRMIAEGYFGENVYLDAETDSLVIDMAGTRRGGNTNWKDSVLDLLANIWQDVNGSAEPAADAVYTKAEQPVTNVKKAKEQAKTHSGTEEHAAPAQTVEAKPEQPEKKKDGRRNYMDELERILGELYDLNVKIEDEAVSAKIDRIGELTAGIFRAVMDNPGREADVRKFMNYYLPTTLKLLKSYDLLEDQSYQGENIVASRAKIESVLDMLIRAFEKQLDRLFQDDALDIATDIDVLETMMAGDGLSEKGQMRTR